MNLVTGAFDISRDPKLNVSHLSAAFGLPEVCAELIELLDVPEFERAWLQYCELYNGPAEQQKARWVRASGASISSRAMRGSRPTRRIARRMRRSRARAWQEFTEGRSGYGPRSAFESHRIEGRRCSIPSTKRLGMSTNATAQWGLAAIECLAYARMPRLILYRA